MYQTSQLMPNEASALLEVAGEVADRLAITPAESLHRAVARRVFRAVGPVATPVRVVHDGIAGAVYSIVRRSTRGVADLAAAGVRAATGADRRPLTATRRGRDVVSAINGLIGDGLAERGNELAIQMTARLGPAPATGRMAVLLHGLGESDESWEAGGFGERLRADLDLTPVYVRYNSGLAVSQNGERLAELLEQLVAEWAVELTQVDLVGHSMGGLVARSACHAAAAAGRRWVALTRNIVTLGTPHTGAPLEKAVYAGAWLLRKVPEASPIAEILDGRSAGIRDLRRGLELPLTADCRHTFISATVTRSARHPVGWAVGDLLVRTASASAGRPELAVHLGRLHHFDLLAHPLVYEQVRTALGGQSTRVDQRSSIRRTR